MITEIWSEGFCIQGNDTVRAFVIAEVYPSNSLDEACQYLYDLDIANNGTSLFSKRDGKWYNWGCQLFDNEKDARKLFG
jgi:hypothetical protein